MEKIIYLATAVALINICAANAQEEIEIEIPCQIFDDEEYFTGTGISRAYTDKGAESAALLAGRDALSEAVSAIVQKKGKMLKNIASAPDMVSSYGTESGNSFESADGYASKDTFDLDDFEVVCLKTEHTKNGTVAHIAVRISKSSPASKENNKIRNLAVMETASETYTNVDEDKKFISSESGLQVELFREEQATSKERTRIFFNPSGAKKFYEMAAQEDFDGT
jgi:hypothetical protein